MSDNEFIIESENDNDNDSISIYKDDIVEIAEKAEKRIEAIKKIKQIALKVTNPNDWVNEGGRPYLIVSGGEKIGRLFGISWRIDEPQFELLDDGHFSYTYKGYFSMRDAEIEAIGTRSSRDPFFRGKKSNPIPPSEIDRGNVKKAAYTNCIGNGVTRLLGIRSLTWEDLETAGIDKDKIAEIIFKKPPMKEESLDTLKKLGELLFEMAGKDKKKASELLEEATTFTASDGSTVKGKSDLKKLTEKQIPITLKKVEKMYDVWKKESGGNNNNASTGDSKPNN